MKAKKVNKNKFFKHLKSIGFSNRLAIYILAFLLIGLLGGFYLALLSINAEYLGSLACWTVAFTPMSTATSIVLSKIVDKSKAENTAGGIKFETAMQPAKIEDFIAEEDYCDMNQMCLFDNSPEV